MEFAIAIPQTYPDPVRIQRFLKRAEELPLVAAWCIEQVIGTVPVLESVTTLAYAAETSAETMPANLVRRTCRGRVTPCGGVGGRLHRRRLDAHGGVSGGHQAVARGLSEGKAPLFGARR